jgi:RNA polymerase sigma factor (sigma-70 family)
VIQDGYGDSPFEDDLAASDRLLVGLALKVVGLRTDPRFHDTLQEGLIEFWKAYSTLPDDDTRVRYSVQRAKLRMQHVAWRNEPLTGQASRQGKPEVPFGPSLDSPIAENLTLGDILGVSQSIEGVEIAYHHGQIVQALNEMPAQHREYVVLRFWGGWTDTEIAKHFGVSTSGMHNRWKRSIQPVLAEKLMALNRM